MRRKELLLVLGMITGLAAPALASPRCHVPMADWQPKQALEDKLKAEGWSIHRIKSDDGCYVVRARRADGQRVKATFAPDTLTLIREKIRED